MNDRLRRQLSEPCHLYQRVSIFAAARRPCPVNDRPKRQLSEPCHLYQRVSIFVEALRPCPVNDRPRRQYSVNSINHNHSVIKFYKN